MNLDARNGGEGETTLRATDQHDPGREIDSDSRLYTSWAYAT